MAGQSISTFAKFSINGTRMCFRQIIDDSVYTRVDDSADTMCGSLDHDSRLVTEGIKIVRFRVIMRPSPQELSILFPCIGLAGSSPTFSLVENFQSSKFTAAIDRVAKVATYSNCMVSRAIFSGARGFRSMQLELHIVGEDITWGAPGTGTFTAMPSRTVGYPLTQGVLSLQGGTRSFNRFGLVIDNHPAVEWNNAVVAGAIEATDRIISLSVSTPYTSDEIALLDNEVSSAAGAAAQLQFSRSGENTTFAFPKLILTPNPPNVPHRSEIRQALTYLAYITNGEKPLTVTHTAAA